MTTLTIDQVRANAPAAFATAPHSGVTARYQFIPTEPIINRLIDRGYVVNKAWQHSRQSDDPNHSIHRIRMSSGVANRIVGGLIPQIDITNSHNRSARLTINAGLFRLVCSNGMVMPIAGMSEHLERIHIIGLYSTDLDAAIDHALQYVDTLPERIVPLQRRILNPKEEFTFARNAVALRYNIAAPLLVSAYKPDWLKVLEPRRTADEEPTLWNVFNRCQEHLTKGTLSRGRELTAPKRDRDFNLALWALTQSYLQ